MSNTLPRPATSDVQASEEFNLVEIWLRRDPARWIAGAFAGIFAALMMWAFVAVLQSAHGGDIWYIPKIFGVPVIGGAAMEYGFQLKSILTGVAVYGLLSILLGVVFAHMTGTNRLVPLFGMGLTWGAFSWVFLDNLFSQSFREVLAVNFPKGVGFFAWMIFGLSMMSVSFFDRIFRGSSR